jgi:hypothetical protein
MWVLMKALPARWVFSCVFDQGPGVRLEKQGLLKMVVYLAGGLNCDSV